MKNSELNKTARRFKFSIKYKFSIYLTLLLLSLMAVLGYLVLNKIENYQLVKNENTLNGQREKAELYIRESIKSSEILINEKDFFIKNCEDMSLPISVLCGMDIELYDLNKNKLASTIEKTQQVDVASLFEYTNNEKEAYFRENDYIYYLSQINGTKGKLGYILFSLSVENDLKFYETLKSYLFKISIIVFIISLFISLVYFNHFVFIIKLLKKSIQSISTGQYNISCLNRDDEFGDLSVGIFEMGNQIEKNLAEITNEKNNMKLALEKLEILGNEQKRFIGNFTHEFKTPLTAINAYADLMGMYQDDPDLITESTSNIKKECERLINMVEKILKLRSIERYSFEYTCEFIRIKPIMEDIIERISGKAAKFGIEISCKLEDAKLFVERESVVHIFINLIDNAIKYNKVNGKININSRKVGDVFKISISDTGSGIPEECWEKVFEPFYRVDKHKKNNMGGTGLGLSIVKEMVKKQNGSIKITKSNSEGTTILLEFPTTFS